MLDFDDAVCDALVAAAIPAITARSTLSKFLSSSLCFSVTNVNAGSREELPSPRDEPQWSSVFFEFFLAKMKPCSSYSTVVLKKGLTAQAHGRGTAFHAPAASVNRGRGRESHLAGVLYCSSTERYLSLQAACGWSGCMFTVLSPSNEILSFVSKKK